MADGANLLSLKFGKIGKAPAEYAAFNITPYNNCFALDMYFERCADGNIELVTHFLWYNYSAELIKPSDNSCGFHKMLLSVFYYILPNIYRNVNTGA